MSELLPCPFCGGQAEIDSDPYQRYFPECLTLTCLFRPDAAFNSIEEAIKAWNTRADLTQAKQDAYAKGYERARLKNSAHIESEGYFIWMARDLGEQ